LVIPLAGRAGRTPVSDNDRRALTDLRVAWAGIFLASLVTLVNHSRESSTARKAGDLVRRVYSNGHGGDLVRPAYERLVAEASNLYLASPYFTEADAIVRAGESGTPVQLLVGLNSITRPEALKRAVRAKNVTVRYLTEHFHPKIFLSDKAALIGSSNLTAGGLQSNREATVLFDRIEDLDTIEEVRAVFEDLWRAGVSVSDGVVVEYERVWFATRQPGPTRDDLIADAMGRASPETILVGSGTKTRERIFIESLRRQVWEQYRPAFTEVSDVLTSAGFRRPELADLGEAHETNRFLNWVRLEHAQGDKWSEVEDLPPGDRRARVLAMGEKWVAASLNHVPATYREWLGVVRRVFGARDALAAADRDTLVGGLMCLHAFNEQLRHVKGGEKAVPATFWSRNDDALSRVKNSIDELLYGSGDFVQRLYDTLYDPARKVEMIGRFTALELYGTVRPDDYPPVNGRMAKALRYLGYDVMAG